MFPVSDPEFSVRGGTISYLKEFFPQNCIKMENFRPRGGTRTANGVGEQIPLSDTKT